jgi:hypothetical protein
MRTASTGGIPVAESAASSEPDSPDGGVSAPRLQEPTGLRKLWLQAAGRQPSLDRLREGIEAASAQQTVRHERPVREPRSCGDAEQVRTSRLLDQYLACAVQAYEGRNANLGWGFIHRFRETETLLLTRAELDAVAVSLAAECSGEKIPGWRGDAIRGLLQRMHNSPYPVVPSAESVTGTRQPITHDDRDGQPLQNAEALLGHDAQLLRAALADRNGYFGNTYTGVAVTSHRRLWLLVLGMLLFAVVGVLLSQLSDLDPQPPANGTASDVLADPWIALTMVTLGALGSVVSAIQRLAVDPLTGPIPAQLGSFTATVTRPLIGAVAALTVFLAASGGLAVPEQHPVPLLLLAAFTAGLTERLVVYREGGHRRGRAAP